MKRVLLMAVVALVAASACFAQPTDVDIVYSGMIPQIVVWDAVTTDINGQPMIEGDTVRYEVFYRHSVTGAEGSLGIVQLPEAVVDLSALSRGYYYIGVRAVGENSEGAVEYSAIAWSNDPMAVGPTLRFVYLVVGLFIPADLTGLRVVGP